MLIYRADQSDAAYLHRLLTGQGVPVEIERYGASTVYIKVNSTRPDIPNLAKSAGRSVRQVFSLDELT